MATPDPDRTVPRDTGGHASTVWTLALATALVGLVAFPRRSATPASAGAEPGRRRSAFGGSSDPAPAHARDEALDLEVDGRGNAAIVAVTKD